MAEYGVLYTVYIAVLWHRSAMAKRSLALETIFEIKRNDELIRKIVYVEKNLAASTLQND